MSKQLVATLSTVIAMLTFSCGGDSLTEDESLPISSVQSELTSISCGALCPPPLLPTGWACSTACPGTCPNATFCDSIPPSASITANPSAVIVALGATVGSSKICWRTSGFSGPVWIKVRRDAEPEALFTKESDRGSECATAAWIAAGSTYEFRISTAKTGGTTLAKVIVTGR